MSSIFQLTQHQILEVSRKVSIGSGLLNEVVSSIEDFKAEIESLSLILACGKKESKIIAVKLKSLLEKKNIAVHSIEEISSNSITEVHRVRQALGITSRSLVVAVGGGKVLDVAKAAINSDKDFLILIPTVLTSDCIYSPITVLKDGDGSHLSYKAKYPSALFVDTQIIKQAPLKLNLAGLGDAISNASALLDCKYAELENNEPLNGLAYVLSNASLDVLLSIGNDFSNSENHLRILGESLVLSGLAMAVSEDTKPCSGAEHLISHAIDRLGYGHGMHGEQVALATYYMHYLRSSLGLDVFSDKYLVFHKNMGLTQRPEDIGMNKDQFIDAIRIAPTMRKKRFTVLNKNIDQQHIVAAYKMAFE
jgi:glycerol-1-phosphate dehydrogenase [NAD(P)+]